jgi:hypothetical protein
MLSPLLLPLLLLPLATLADPGLDVNPDLLPSYSSFTHLGYTFSLTSSSFSASLPGSPAPLSNVGALPFLSAGISPFSVTERHGNFKMHGLTLPSTDQQTIDSVTVHPANVTLGGSLSFPPQERGEHPPLLGYSCAFSRPPASASASPSPSAPPPLLVSCTLLPNNIELGLVSE